MILDIHSHRPAPYPEGIICASPADFSPSPGQLYSLGIHPWEADSATPALLEKLDELAALPSVVLIGEAGIDLGRPGAAPLFRQMLLLRHHIELSERLGKPLIIHDVKAHDIIIGLRNDLRPRQPWILHGFRAKPTVARMFTRLNPPSTLHSPHSTPGPFLFSLGPRFNPDTLRTLPESLILAETDDSGADIRSVIAALSAVRGQDLLPSIAGTTARLLHP